MPESDAMPPEEPASKSLLENPHEESAGKPLLEKPPEESAGKSLLEKPLHLLTEDDISQLTREDCRRYLKEKGMRRPSWNKSQAIQQVIMLKKLLEADSLAGSPKRHNISCSSNPAIIVPGGTNMDAKISVSAERSMPHPVKDPNKPHSSGVLSGRIADANDESAQPRTIQTTNIAARQMTIFYGGKVNVYDDIPTDKARTILHIAASPLEFPEEQLNDGTILQPLPGFPKAVSTEARQDSAGVILPTLHTVSTRDNSLMLGEEKNIMLLEGTPVEGPSTRKASVQRYLEKRKDRFKSKRKAGTTSCSSLDVYFNHQLGNQIPRIDRCSLMQTRQTSTPARCSSVDDDSVKHV